MSKLNPNTSPDMCFKDQTKQLKSHENVTERVKFPWRMQISMWHRASVADPLGKRSSWDVVGAATKPSLIAWNLHRLAETEVGNRC